MRNSKQIKQLISLYAQERNNKESIFDEENRRIVNINVHDDTDFLSSYSSMQHQVISEDVATYIDNHTLDIKGNQKMHLKIYSNEIDNGEKLLYDDAIRNYYFNKTKESERTIKQTWIFSGIFFLTALVIFLGLFVFDLFASISILAVMFEIVGWVFLWEVVHLSGMQVFLTYQERNKNRELMSAKISFLSLEELQLKEIQMLEKRKKQTVATAAKTMEKPVVSTKTASTLTKKTSVKSASTKNATTKTNANTSVKK